MTAPDEKPLPCPYCGSQPKVETGMGWHRVVCSADDVGDGEPCDAEGPSSRSTGRAIAAWNRVARHVEPADVTWAGTGLDRLHVPTGTVWRFGHVAWLLVLANGVAHVSRPSAESQWNWGWSSNKTTGDAVGTAPTDSAAMAAALAAAGWTP